MFCVAISIHASHEGSDIPRFGPSDYDVNFNPRFPRGKRLLPVIVHNLECGISIHASREGSDPSAVTVKPSPGLFQSTLPAREATRYYDGVCCSQLHFNPRFPRGKRHEADKKERADQQFQSTLPAREATACGPEVSTGKGISIHASREGSDAQSVDNLKLILIFQSTLPAREATNRHYDTLHVTNNFNPRFPRGKRR